MGSPGNGRPLFSYPNPKNPRAYRDFLRPAAPNTLPDICRQRPNKSLIFKRDFPEKLRMIRAWFLAASLLAFSALARANAPVCEFDFASLAPRPAALKIGKDVIPEMKRIIASAEKELWLEWRDFPPPEIVAQLIEKKKAGVDVRIILDGREFKKSAELVAQYQKTLRDLEEAGVDVAVSNIDELSRYREYPRASLHRKFIVADGRETYVGSANIGKNQGNYEIGLFRDTGAPELKRLFELDYQTIKNGWRGAETTVQETKFFSPGSEDGVKLFGLGTGTPDAKKEILEAIRQAEKRLWISTFEASDPDILKAILAKKKQNPGIDLKVVLCEEPMSLWMKNKQGVVENTRITKSSNYLRQLMQNGIEVRAYSEPGSVNHSRFLVSDQDLLGMSGDLTKRSFDANVELGFRSQAPELLADGAQGFENLWRASHGTAKPSVRQVWREKFFDWYQDYLGFLIRSRNAKNAIPPPPSKRVTYGIEIEFDLDSKILDFYRLPKSTDEAWAKLGPAEKKAAFGKFLSACKGKISALLHPECAKGLPKIAGAPGWMPANASFELHGTVELSGFVFEDLAKAKEFSRLADSTFGVGYYQGHVVWPKRAVPGLYGYLGFQYDKSALLALAKGFQKWEKTGEIPAKSFARRALGYPDASSAARIRGRTESIAPEVEVGKGGMDRLISGPVLRDDVYPEGWIGVEHRQFHRNPGVMIEEMDSFSSQVKNGSFEDFRAFEGFEGVSARDAMNLAKYTQAAEPADLLSYLRKLDLKMRYDHGLFRTGASSFADRFLLPLKDWESHPVLLSLSAEDRLAAQSKIAAATKAYGEELARLSREGLAPDSEDKIRIAISRWAHDSGLSAHFENYGAKK